MTDSYRTIARPAAARLTRKKSRFIARLYPVSSEEEIGEIRARLRREYHDATHLCFAYRLISGTVHADDAGEPAGSAGPPILHALEGAGLYDVLAVVIRYFGGIKLGIGGLIRAYGDVTQAAIAAAEIVTRMQQVRVEIVFPPELTSPVMGLIHRVGADVEKIDYNSNGLVVILLPRSALSRFADQLREVTGNRARIMETK